jgi:hypothetical protein
MALVRTDVSEEPNASIIRVIRIVELGTDARCEEIQSETRIHGVISPNATLFCHSLQHCKGSPRLGSFIIIVLMAQNITVLEHSEPTCSCTDCTGSTLTDLDAAMLANAYVDWASLTTPLSSDWPKCERLSSPAVNTELMA